MIQSPGEGEAMCAALNKAGIVDACATFDGDVLLFGAHTVYHTLKLQVIAYPALSMLHEHDPFAYLA